MIRNEFTPPSTLRHDIKCFWTLEQEATEYNTNTIVPDAYIEVVINCGAPLWWETDEGDLIELPEVFVNGLQKKPIRFRGDGFVQMLGMRLYPWAVFPITGLPANQTDVPLVALVGQWKKVVSLLKKTMHRGEYAETVHTMEQFVTDTRTSSLLEFGLVQTMLTHLYSTQGQARISDLAITSHLSASQFERQVKALTGVSPKLLARLIRFQTVCNHLVCVDSYRLTDIAHDFGFTDQSHFIRDFRALAHNTPRAYATHTADTPWQQWRRAALLESPQFSLR